MSMPIEHYVGYYFKCEKRDDISEDISEDFSSLNLWLVVDENSSMDINTNHIYAMPDQRESRVLYDTGIIKLTAPSDFAQIPDDIILAEIALKKFYDNVELLYGVVSYCY